jgi:hypothetical protein
VANVQPTKWNWAAFAAGSTTAARWWARRQSGERVARRALANFATRVTPSPLQREQGRIVASGLVAGALCYLVAGLSTPIVASADEHDLGLTRRLGFILAPVLGLWLGWLQRSWRRALIGGSAGLLLGWLCLLLCSGPYRPVLLALPILLAAMFAACCGSQRHDWLRCLPLRFAKGLAVGLFIGLLYLALLGIGAQVLWPRTGSVDYLDAHIRMMWRAGPLALAVSGALLLPALRWAAGLTRAGVAASGSAPQRAAAASKPYDDALPQGA